MHGYPPARTSSRLITFRNLAIARGAKALVRNLTLTIHARERIGIVGANGCGKSSLLAALAGELYPDAGEIQMPPGLAIAQVAQETPATELPAIEYVLDGDAELRATQAALSRAEITGDAERVAVLHQDLERIYGYSARGRSAAWLHGLGFAPSVHATPVAAFSGGWRMRLNLGRALFARSDLLLLDEPTNHLDLDAVIWLERWLASYRGTLLLVSHDRDFLDAIIGRVLHFEAEMVVSYSGNYSMFENARAQALSGQQAAYVKQQREIAHLRGFVERFRAKATKARQAQSRMKALARMESIAPAHVDTPFTFTFASPQSAPSPLIGLDRACFGYSEHTVLAEVTISILPGSRIGLIGRNGAGKSTFIRALVGELPLVSGERREGRGLAIGYFAQHQLEQLRSDESPLQHLVRIDPSAREQELRDFLGRFGFVADQALAAVGPFSGGERSRLALALIVRARPNLLLLDEPTNHLDLEMRHALTLALQEYEGAVVLVSHDRHMLRTTADDLWLVAGGRVQPFDGDLDDYGFWLQASETKGERSTDSRITRKDERRERAQRQNEIAAKRRPFEARIRALEGELAALESERDAIDRKLGSNATYGSSLAEQIAALHKRRAEIELRLEVAEARWYEAQHAIEAIDRD
jgi:ATP-binding cassette subfamily F protein 3